MKKLLKLSLLAASLISVLIFGGRTTAQAQTAERYADAPLISTYASTTINYNYRTVDYKETPGGAPNYRQVSEMTNACGAVAGTTIVGFYDKYYDNMIPGWNSYYASGLYRLQDSVHVPAVMWEMYDLMQTNVKDVGVSEQEFVDGLKAYINGQGYSVSMQNVVSGSSIDYQACKNAINNNKVIALLSHAGDVYDLGEYSDHDTVTTINIAGSHIMVAYGYYEINYYDSNNKLFRTDMYLDVATGLSVPQTALYKVNPHNLSSAYIVNVS
ncbi:MAG: hypothetical protein J1F61_05480 [Clostridiales bacterium]|nr:hypothetical protein [Clostridiales bacterium]